MENESPGFISRTELPFEVIDQGHHGNFTKPIELQIGTQKALDEIYATINSTRTPSESAPKIDFSKYWVGFVGLGEKNTGGYSVKVKHVVRSGYETTVELEATEPNGMATMVITSPYVIFKVEQQANAMKFKYVSSN